MIYHLQHADQLEIVLNVAAAAKIPDICEKHARCYSCAHGVAAAICHAQSRIFGRPVEQHGKLASELIDRWGCESADVRGILNDACGSRGLHYEELDLVETGDIVPRRHVLASFELDEASWQVLEACLRYPAEASTVPLRACDIQSDRTATQQRAAFFICGQGYSNGFDVEFWFVMDLLGRRMKVEKHALQLRYYDVFFYISDLSEAEISLFNSAARVLDVEIKRASTWIKGLEPLGWTVNRKTLQVEWTASWGPIADYNSAVSLDQQVHPGHIIQCVNGAVGQHHFFRGKGYGGGMGDQLYFQGHAAPGAYARAYLEGRLDLEHVMHFRQEVGGTGLSSYPHPRLMPDFWENPTVSMGLGPLQSVCQARYFRYLHLRGLCDTSASRVWCFIGDGEMDEPETIYAIARAGYERLNNLVMIVNCNYQRLDGPVRGNSKVIQEFEGIFRGAGFDCIKLIWGDAWNDLVDNDHDGKLIEVLERTPDGDCQRYAAKQDGGLIRREIFEANGLADRVAHMSDDELLSAFMLPGGHDHKKIYSAMLQAEKNAETGGRPTVILAKTLKGFSLATFQGRNTVHQQKSLKVEEMMSFRDVLEIPLTDEQIKNPEGGEFFRKPASDSPELRYVMEKREKLGGCLPMRTPAKVSGLIDLPPADLFT
ncbi:aceE, partial [Symbiodinium sp. CCMP2456]